MFAHCFNDILTKLHMKCVVFDPTLSTGVSGMVVALFALSAAQGGLPSGTEDAALAAAAAAGDDGVNIAAWASALALLLYVGSYQVRQAGVSLSTQRAGLS
jgi:hypothetical protein